jgi:uncharacterized protein
VKEWTMDNSVVDIFRSECFWAPFWAWTVAQITKMLIGFTHTRKFDFSYMVSTGGMPSAHSALVCGLCTAVGLTAGFGSAVFMVALAFSLVTMFDATTVRHAAGEQARLLNEIIDEIRTEHHFPKRKLKELLGHTRLEVFLGMIIGILVGTITVTLSRLMAGI